MEARIDRVRGLIGSGGIVQWSQSHCLRNPPATYSGVRNTRPLNAIRFKKKQSTLTIGAEGDKSESIADNKFEHTRNQHEHATHAIPDATTHSKQVSCGRERFNLQKAE